MSAATWMFVLWIIVGLFLVVGVIVRSWGPWRRLKNHDARLERLLDDPDASQGEIRIAELERERDAALEERDDFRSRFELRLEVEALARAVAAERKLEAVTDALREIEAECERRREIGGISCAFVRRVLAEAPFSVSVSGAAEQTE